MAAELGRGGEVDAAGWDVEFGGESGPEGAGGGGGVCVVWVWVLNKRVGRLGGFGGNVPTATDLPFARCSRATFRHFGR